MAVLSPPPIFLLRGGRALGSASLCALAASMAFGGGIVVAQAGTEIATQSYWASGVSKNGGWHDFAKNWIRDKNMCWAASASNVLGWWQDKFVIPSGVPAGEDIWNTVRNSFVDDTGLQKTVYNMWFNGSGAAGGYYKSYNWFSLANKVEETDVAGGFMYGITASSVSALVRSKFENGWGLSVGVAEKGTNFQHAITVWGAELTNGVLSRLWITDSDDRKNALVEFKVENKNNNFYVVPETYAGFFERNKEYYIHKYVWLDSNADFLPQAVIPEPSVFGLLAGTAAIALAGTRRRKANAANN